MVKVELVQYNLRFMTITLTSLLYLISKFALWRITNFIFCIWVLLESYFPFHNVANPIRLSRILSNL